MKLVEEIMIIIKPAVIQDPASIEKLFTLTKELEILAKTKMVFRIDGSSRTRNIFNWKLHATVVHIPEWVAMWGSMGLYDEQMVEKMHQSFKQVLVVMAAQDKFTQAKSAAQRLLNRQYAELMS